MDQLDEAYRGRLTALQRAMSVAKGVRDGDDPCQIEEGLYLGSIGAANNKSALRSLNITHILTVTSSVPPYPDEFKYKIVNVQDRHDVIISRYFDDCFAFIDEANEMGGKVLVHCFAGISRSVTIIVAYLIKKRGLSCSVALEHVKSKRAIASPNPGFLLQLQNFEKSLRGKMAELSFGNNLFAKKSHRTAPEQPRPTALFLATQRNVAEKNKSPKKRPIQGGGRGEPSKEGKHVEGSSPSSLATTFGELAKDNFQAADVKTWSNRTKDEAAYSFKMALGETFFHGLNFISSKDAEIVELTKSLKKAKEAAFAYKQQVADAQNKASEEASVFRKEIDRLQGVLGEATEEAKKREELHGNQLLEIQTTLNEYESERDKDLSDAYSQGILGYLKSFLGAHPDYDWSAFFPPSTVRYMNKFKVDNAQVIEEERAKHESKLKAELDAVAVEEARKKEDGQDANEGKDGQGASPSQA